LGPGFSCEERIKYSNSGSVKNDWGHQAVSTNLTVTKVAEHMAAAT